MARQYGLPAKSTLAEPPAERGNHHYRKLREPFAAELKDPATRRFLRGLIHAENPGAGSAVVESLMNRTAMVNETRAAKGQPPLTLKSMIHGDASIGGGKSFYGPIRDGRINGALAYVDRNPDYAKRMDSHIDSALGGADTIRGHTDQGSRGDPNYINGGIGVNINGERFNDWGYGGSRAWREKQQALAMADQPLDPTPNVGAGESTYAANAETGTPSGTGGIGSDSARAPNQPYESPTAVASTLGKKIGSGVGDSLEDLGKLYATGPVAKNAAASGPANVQAPQMPTPMGPIPVVDPRAAEAQRQQLAMALQRLNSGKLV